MQIPFIDLNRPEPGLKEAIEKRWLSALENYAFIGGDVMQDLERGLLEYTGARYFVPTANGTDAIQIALRAAGVGASDKVIVPDLTFWASLEAIINVGADPVIVDVNCKDLQLDYDLTVQAIEQHSPKAIILVHLYGWCSSRLAEFRQLCKERDIRLIEDGAQALGVEYQGESVFSGAEIITTSFYPAKVLGAAGDAGGIFARDMELAKVCSSLANHGRSEHYEYAHIGWNSRMDSLQAHFLVENLKHLPARIESRLQSERYYLDNIQGIEMLTAPENVSHNGYLQVSLAKGAAGCEQIRARLRESGIATGKVYPSTMHSQKALQGLDIPLISNGVADDICGRVFNLPLFPYMTSEELEYIVEQVN